MAQWRGNKFHRLRPESKGKEGGSGDTGLGNGSQCRAMQGAQVLRLSGDNKLCPYGGHQSSQCPRATPFTQVELTARPWGGGARARALLTPLLPTALMQRGHSFPAYKEASGSQSLLFCYQEDIASAPMPENASKNVQKSKQTSSSNVLTSPLLRTELNHLPIREGTILKPATSSLLRTPFAPLHT